jgi:hypothetical protein
VQVTIRRTQVARSVLTVIAVLVAALVALHGDPTDIIRNASGVGNDATFGAQNGGLQNFVKAADALVDPAIVALAAITPIACIVGGGAMMFGNRKGLVIIGAALGTLVFVASIKGIVA